MISISGINTEQADVFRNEDNRIKEILFSTFNDTEIDNPVLHPLTEAQAEEIAKFVRKHKDDIRRIVVHCFMGASRSVAVGASIEEYCNGFSKILNNFASRPNQLVLRKMRDAFGIG